MQERGHYRDNFFISNFIAALGGGAVLGKATHILDVSYLHGGGILAFFLGTVLGLVFLQVIPKRFSSHLAQGFAFGSGISSIVLFYLFQHYAIQGKMGGVTAVLFFLILCVRFGLWFYARVMRVSTTAKRKKTIAFVEFGYYFGMVCGLIIWNNFSMVFSIGMVLVIDVLSQFIAGVLDFGSYRNNVTEINNNKMFAMKENMSLFVGSKARCWQLLSGAVSITLGIQVVIFNTAHHITEIISTYVLAVFYLGVALAAFLSNQFGIYLSWTEKGRARMILKQFDFRTSVFFLILGAGILVSYVVLCSQQVMNGLWVLFPAVFLSAFIFEVLSIGLLDSLGKEEQKLANPTQMMMLAYGFMGITSAFGFWILSLTERPSLALAIVGSCLTLTWFLIEGRFLFTKFFNKNIRLYEV